MKRLTRWTHEEEEILEKNYRRMGAKVARLLPGKSVHAIRHKAQYQMWRAKPTQEEYDKLVREHPGMSMAWYARTLGVTRETAYLHIRGRGRK